MLKFLLPAGEAKSEASLIRTLTQYGLNATKFCTEFNQKSLEGYPKGLLVTVYLQVNVETKASVMVLGLGNLRFILQSMGVVNMERLYDLYRIVQLISKDIYSVVMFFGTLRSLKGMSRIKRRFKYEN